jgi:phosphoglycerate dehydrogenase-like enzyme
VRAALEPLTIYCNSGPLEPAAELLAEGVAPHRLLWARGGGVSLGARGQADPQLLQADIALGQPEVGQVIGSPRLRWVHITSAGYTAYDREDVRAALGARGAALTKSSLVYDEPCAEQLLAFLCTHARQLPAALLLQHTTRTWPQRELRGRAQLLRGQVVALVGFGSIARRLCELLAPLRMDIVAIRRHPTGDEPVPTLSLDDPAATLALARADHVIDVLPASPATERFFDGARLALFKPGAVFYNVGRGTTVDQEALRAALLSGALAAAYLDVTTPEPLPPDHPLWTTPGCHISPHIAGGHRDEPERLVRHFLDNLRRFTGGGPLLDRVF